MFIFFLNNLLLKCNVICKSLTKSDCFSSFQIGLPAFELKIEKSLNIILTYRIYSNLNNSSNFQHVFVKKLKII